MLKLYFYFNIIILSLFYTSNFVLMSGNNNRMNLTWFLAQGGRIFYSISIEKFQPPWIIQLQFVSFIILFLFLFYISIAWSSLITISVIAKSVIFLLYKIFVDGKSYVATFIWISVGNHRAFPESSSHVSVIP